MIPPKSMGSPPSQETYRAPLKVAEWRVAWQYLKIPRISYCGKVGQLTIYKYIYIHIYWLVVDLPLWKIWVRQLGWWHSQLNGHIKVMFQTTNQNKQEHSSTGLWRRGTTVLSLGGIPSRKWKSSGMRSTASSKSKTTNQKIIIESLDNRGELNSLCSLQNTTPDLPRCHSHCPGRSPRWSCSTTRPWHPDHDLPDAIHLARKKPGKGPENLGVLQEFWPKKWQKNTGIIIKDSKMSLLVDFLFSDVDSQSATSNSHDCKCKYWQVVSETSEYWLDSHCDVLLILAAHLERWKYLRFCSSAPRIIWVCESSKPISWYQLIDSSPMFSIWVIIIPNKYEWIN